MSENPVFDSNNILGDGISQFSRSKLVALAVELCAIAFKESGESGYRGGIRPDNISIDSEGSVAIGPAEKPNKDDCSKAELEYISPELFWSGNAGSRSDVYSIGLLVYNGITGKLPFVTSGSDADCAEAFRKRMNGDKIKLPPFVGKKLRHIIEQSLEFSADARYENTLELASELKALLDKPDTQAISKAAMEAFGKSEAELSEIEKMMLGIITSASVNDDLADLPPEEQEEEEADIEVELEELPPEPDEPEDEESIEVEFEELPPEPEIITPVEELTVDEIVEELIAEKNGTQLEPIEVPEFVNAAPKSAPVPKVPAAPVKQKKRVGAFTVIVALCAVLAVTAFIYNKISVKNTDETLRTLPPIKYITPEPTEKVSETYDPTIAPTTVPNTEPQPTQSPELTEKPQDYQVFCEDIGWDAAEQKCKDNGGHLAAISNADEFAKVCELLNRTGAKYAWVGCYRSSSGNLTWTNGDETDYYVWAANEPSYSDAYDGTSEDYIMLVRQPDGSWKYNDSRINPVADYPYYYSGALAYVFEASK